MSEQELNGLRDLLRTFGAYKVLRTVMEIVQAESEKGYNPDAVIYRDLPVIRNAVETMMGNHPIRRFD
jgi:hypothetical protein